MRIFFLILLLSLPGLAWTSAVADVPWSYSWQGQDGQAHEIELTIPSHLAERAFITGKDLFDFKKISSMIFTQAKDLAATLSDDRVTLKLYGSGIDNFDLSASALPKDKALADERMQKIHDFILGAMIPVEQSTYYTFDRAQKRLGIEYNEIAQDYKLLVLDTLIALSDELGTADPHGLRDGLLVMLQSIEYSDLANDDFPLLNPARMLIERRGDCESKQVFMATAVKLLFPDHDVHLIQLFDQEHIVMTQTEEGGHIVSMDATAPPPPGESPYYINPKYLLFNGTPYEIVL